MVYVVIGATAGGALQPTVQPSIVGTIAVGTSVRVDPGTWSQPLPTFKFQWLRSGVPIPERDLSDVLDQAGGRRQGPLGHRPRQQDRVQRRRLHGGVRHGAEDEVDHDVDPLEDAHQEGQDGQGRSARQGPGITTPFGIVKIQDGVKTLKSFTLDPFRKGVMTVKLSTKKLKPGRHKIKLVYMGNAATEKSKAKVIRLIVVR